MEHVVDKEILEKAVTKVVKYYFEGLRVKEAINKVSEEEGIKMFKNIPSDLLERFNKYYEKGNILDFKVREEDDIKTETIYYEYFNVLGVLKKTTILKSKNIYIDDNALTVGEVEVFLEKSRWFK